MGVDAEREARGMNDSTSALTRTTLRMPDETVPSAAAAFLVALKRVPGVLLAEIDTIGSNVVITHDPALRTTALLAAIAGTGGSAEIVDRPKTTRSSGSLFAAIRAFFRTGA